MIQEDKKTVTEKVQKEATEVVQKGTEEVQKGTEEVQETAKASSEEAASFLGDWLQPLEPYPLLYAVVVTVGLLILLWFTHLIIRFLVIKPLIGNRLMDRVKWIHVDDLGKSKVLSSVSSILSMGIIGMVVDVLPRFEPNYLLNAHRVVDALFVFFVAQLIVRTANLLDMMYSRLPSVNRPGALRGYVSVGSFLVYGGALVLMVSAILAKSPVYFLTGLGAVSAILLILFRDTLLSMFANIIVTTGDLARVGDWIHVPSSNADGYVIDVSLNVVKVQNFDKTITVLPTYLLVQESFVNYRGMYMAGGRRIKRSIMLDQRTIRPLSNQEMEALSVIPLMDKAMELNRASLTSTEGQDRTINSGLFRHYVVAYLQTHPKIHNDQFTLLVRQLQPTDEGLPIELYCFVKDTAWAAFEEVQATIFDQLLATLPAFGLRVIQGESDFAEPDAVPRRLEVAPEVFKAGPSTPP